MKKIFTILIAALFGFITVTAQETVAETTTTTSSVARGSDEILERAGEGKKTKYNDFKDFTHWSIAINGGMSQFDGDVTQKYNNVFSASQISWTAGLDIEYTWNPYWGIIAQFQYMPYLGTTGTSEYGHNEFEGNMYTPSLMVSLNALNVFGQYRKNWRWALYLNAGVGYTFYDVKSKPVTTPGPTMISPTDISDGMAISIPVGINLEYNVSDHLAIGLDAYYRMHNKDNFEAEHYIKGNTNDGEFYSTLSLRYKIAAHNDKREGGHMRNLTSREYQEMKNGVKELRDEVDSLDQRVTVIEDTILNELFPRVEALEAMGAMEPDEDEDGVPDIRDREPNTPEGAYVNYWGESLPSEITECCEEVKAALAVAGIGVNGEGVDYNMSVYFPSDKYYLTNQAKGNVELAAKKLKENPEMNVELRGYCDYPGSGNYNMKLSANRVETVKNELVKKYGIDASRITLMPKGKLSNPPLKELKNRRCDFFFFR